MTSASTETECLFCTLYHERKGVMYENEFFYAQFDQFPITPGHAEVIPKRHVLSLFDLKPQEWESLLGALQDAVKIIETTDLQALYTQFIEKPLNEKSAWYCQKMLDSGNVGRKPDGYNFGNNDGEAAGRTIHHLHIHIIPRYKGDVDDPRGGIRHIIPGMGNYRI